MLYDNEDNERCVIIIIDEHERNTLIENINGDYRQFENCKNFQIGDFVNDIFNDVINQNR